MSRQRLADTKLLELLRRMPAALELAEVGAILRWSRQRVRQVVFRLAAEQAVTVRQAPGDGTVGRAPLEVCLPGTPGVYEGPAPTLARDTIVVTPLGHEARVLKVSHSIAEIEYISGPEKHQTAAVHVRLLRAFQPGRERPEPVRVVDAVKEAA